MGRAQLLLSWTWSVSGRSMWPELSSNPHAPMKKIELWALSIPASASPPTLLLPGCQTAPGQIYLPPRIGLISWPNTEIQITFRSATMSFLSSPPPPLPLPSLPSPSAGPAVSAKLPSGVSEREQLRFTNNDEACHASFSIRHGGPGGAVGRAVPVFFIKASSVWNTPPAGLFTAPRSSAAPTP